MKFDNMFMNVVEKELSAGLIPMLLGEPGIGKSSWVIGLGDHLHTKVFVLPCNQLADKADLTGARLVPIKDANGNVVDYKQMFYPHAIVSDAIKYAEDNPRETPILFMDELNRTTPDVTSECLSIPTLRAIGSKKLPKNLKVIVAGNDKGNVTSLDSASITRFALHHVSPDVGTFLQVEPNLNPYVQKVLQQHPECIFCKQINLAVTSPDANNDDDDDDSVDIDDILMEGDEMMQIATPRTIAGVSRWLNLFNNQELMAMLSETHTIDGIETSTLQEILEGHTGKTNFTVFLLAEITSGVMTNATAQNNVNVAKPNCYDDMKKCPDVTALNTFIANMSDNEKSGCMVYALYEKADNKVYINALASVLNTITPGDTKVLMQLSLNDELDEENKQALLATKSAFANSVNMMLNFGD